MSKVSLIENQWVDIVIPPPPESQMLLWWSLSITLIFIISIGVNLVWRHQPRQQFKRKLNSLLSIASTATNSDQKQALHQLEKLLCQYHNVAQLSYINISHAQWPLLRQQLQQACYQNLSSDQQQTINLIQQTQLIFLESKA